MKRETGKRIVVIAMMCVCALAAMAQISLGVRVGTNLHEVSLNNVKDNFETSNRYGFYVGPTVDVSLLAGLGIEGSLLYENRKIRLDSDGLMDEKTSHYLTIPLNVRYAFGAGKLASFYLSTGPQFSYSLKKDEWIVDQDDDKELRWGLRDAEMTWNVGAGLTLLRHIRVGYTYNVLIGAKEEYKHGFWVWDDKLNKTWQHNAHQVSLTYYF